MTAAPSSADLDRPALELSGLWVVAGAVSTLFLVLLPLASPAILFASSAVFLASQGRFALARPSPVIVALLLIDIYLLVNLSWSLSPRDGLRSVGLLFAITGLLYLTLNALAADSERSGLRSIAMGLVLGAALGGLIYCIEALSGQGMRRALMAYLPALAPNAEGMGVSEDGSPVPFAALMNRSIAAIALLFWPAVLIVDRLDLSPRLRMWLLIALLPGIVAIMRSAHGTSKLAFLGAAALYVLCRFYPVLGPRLARAGWLAAVVLMVPAASLAYSAQLHHSGWLAESARHRVVIWNHTVGQIGKAPLLGSGVATARALNERDKPDAQLEPGTAYRLVMSHSHNGYLQVWYETGAIGAFLLLGFGLLVLRSLAQAESGPRAYLHAIFAACALMAGSAFSLWAPWLLALFAIVAICAAVAMALPAATDARTS